MSYKKQTIFGLIWSFTDIVVLKGLSFAAGIFLARLLGPSEFGLIGMISVFIAIGISLVDSGLSSSIIRTKNTDDKDYSTVFFMNLGLSCLVYIILYFLAPYISKFYNQLILIKIIRVYCISFIISALSNVQLAILNKKMQFRKILIYNIPGTVIGIIVGIILAYNNYGVWSIIFMYLLTQLIQTIILWLYSDWKPRLNFSKEKLKLHYSFGYKLMLSGLLDTLFKNIFNVLIGKFYSIQSLGYYERARSFNDYPVSAITSIMSKVSYPLLADLQDQKEQIANVYRQLIQSSFFIMAPLMLGLASISDPLFLLLLGNDWQDAVPFFQVLCFAGMLYPIHAFNINVLKVFGRSDLFLKLELIKKTILLVSILIAFNMGVLALVWCSVFVSVVALGVNMYYSSELINYSAIQQLRDLIPIMIKSILMVISILAFNTIIPVLKPIYQVLLLTTMGITTYFTINYYYKSDQLYFIINIIKNRKL